MIFLGNGDQSGAACWRLVSDLVGLLIDLGGLQQPLHADSPEAAERFSISEALDRQRWEERAEGFLWDIARALGYEAKLTQIKE
jgi:hypothetical protein